MSASPRPPRPDPSGGNDGRLETTLVVNEIFHSIQGESRHAGRPCVFVRLTGCNLRCVWCDTAYAFEEGGTQTVAAIADRVAAFGTRYVLLTGGEPLLQAGVHDLAAVLLDRGHEVAIETGGGLDIAPLDRRVMVVLDVKCPGSGMAAKNRWENLALLKPTDEFYGDRVCMFLDPDGYEWKVSKPLRHVSVDEVKQFVSRL